MFCTYVGTSVFHRIADQEKGARSWNNAFSYEYGTDLLKPWIQLPRKQLQPDEQEKDQ